jgi:threonine/homoserine/homoserine lactone efflux protein
VLAVAFGLAATISVSVWCAFGALMARLIRTDAQWRGLNIALAVLLALSIVQVWF